MPDIVVVIRQLVVMAYLETIKLTPKTKQNLRLIAAKKNEKLYEVMLRLSEQELKKLKLA